MADRRLQIFHAVAKEASFTRAAEALFMSQPAVTFQIRQLEEQYQTRLFERRHQRVTLTPAGQLLFEYAERILALNDEMDARLQEVSGEMRGALNIGASQTLAVFVMPDLLLAFNDHHPQVRLRLSTGLSEDIERRVAEHLLDVALLEAPPRLPGLAADLVAEDELLVICAPDHPLAESRKLSAKTLADYEYIAREPGSATRAATDDYFRRQKVDPAGLKVQLELGAQSALKRVVERGLGYAVASRLAVDHEVTNGTLCAIPLRPALKRGLYLVYPEDRFRTQLVSSFLDFAKRQLKDMLP